LHPLSTVFWNINQLQNIFLQKMKSTKYFFVLAILFALALVSNNANAQNAKSIPMNCTPFANVCVGDCGDAGNFSYTVTAYDVMNSWSPVFAFFCVSAGHNSLCPNEIAMANVMHNGSVVYSGPVSELGTETIKAVEGDVISITLTTVPGDLNVRCFWRGTSEVVMGRR